MELGVLAGRGRQVCFPFGVVEALVPIAVGVEDLALRVVVELDPEAVELDGLEEVVHFLVFAERALGGCGDDVVAVGGCD